MSKRIKVLFLPKWYPCRNRPISGIFIKRHGEILTEYCNVFVLYVIGDERLKGKWLDFEFNFEEGLEILRVYYRKKIIGLGFLDYAVRFILYMISFKQSYYI